MIRLLYPRSSIFLHQFSNAGTLACVPLLQRQRFHEAKFLRTRSAVCVRGKNTETTFKRAQHQDPDKVERQPRPTRHGELQTESYGASS